MIKMNGKKKRKNEEKSKKNEAHVNTNSCEEEVDNCDNNQEFEFIDLAEDYKWGSQ